MRRDRDREKGEHHGSELGRVGKCSAPERLLRFELPSIPPRTADTCAKIQWANAFLWYNSKEEAHLTGPRTSLLRLWHLPTSLHQFANLLRAVFQQPATYFTKAAPRTPPERAMKAEPHQTKNDTNSMGIASDTMG